MKIKNLIIWLIGVIVIFLSYFYIKPINKSLLSKENLIFDVKNINKDNNLSAFINEGKGNFYIHPGSKKPAGVTFLFRRDGNLKLFFFLSNKAKSGNVKYKVLKNKQTVALFTIKQKEKKEIKLDIKKQDTLTIWADKNGDIKDDIAYFNMSYIEPLYNLKKFIIPFLWSLLFIFLLGKNYKYIAINSYIGFLLVMLAEKLNFGYLEFKSIITYTILLFAITFIFVFVYQELSRLKKFKVATILSYIATILIYLVPLSLVIYALNYNTPFSRDALFAVFQSNSKESLDYISDFIAIKYIILFIIVTIAVGAIFYIQEKKETNKIEKSLLMFLIIVFISIVFIDFSSLRLPNFIIKNFKRYGYEIKQFKEVQKRRKAGSIKFSATKKGIGETYIFIIGESLNKKHMGVYNYIRETTPNLTKMYKNKELKLFNNVYSNHTHTVFVLDLALTEANQYNHKKFFNSVSIIDVLKKSGFETYWLTNQPLYSMYDNMVSVIATSADHVVALNTSVGGIPGKNRHYYDGPLIDRVKKVLSQKSNKNRAIFVHLGGSHTTYVDRYPNDKYTIFSGDLNQGEFGLKASKVKNINSYDNSVYYNDYVVSSIIKEFKKDNSAYALFYMSDHTDDVIGGVAHNSAMFTYYMTQIPFIAWFSDKYKKEYPNRYATLLSHKDKLFSNDMLYDTIIGVYGIKTDRYNSKYDFSSSNYKLNYKDALVLHGKKHYASKENHIFWQKFNAKYLKDNNQTKRVFPKRVNSTGKLHDILNNGYSSFKIDITIDNNKTAKLVVGNSPKLLGLEFNNYISKIDLTIIKKIVIDVKNLNSSNYNIFLKELFSIEKKFNIKSKSIIKTSLTNRDFLNKLTQNSWRVAYELPLDTINKLIKQNNYIESEKLSNNLSNKIKELNISSIYFNQNIYNWVKKYLEPKLDKTIAYHIDTNFTLYDTNLKDKLNSSKLNNDNRVKTILVKFDSQFEL